MTVEQATQKSMKRKDAPVYVSPFFVDGKHKRSKAMDYMSFFTPERPLPVDRKDGLDLLHSPHYLFLEQQGSEGLSQLHLRPVPGQPNEKLQQAMQHKITASKAHSAIGARGYQDMVQTWRALFAQNPELLPVQTDDKSVEEEFEKRMVQERMDWSVQNKIHALATCVAHFGHTPYNLEFYEAAFSTFALDTKQQDFVRDYLHTIHEVQPQQLMQRLPFMGATADLVSMDKRTQKRAVWVLKAKYGQRTPELFDSPPEDAYIQAHFQAQSVNATQCFFVSWTPQLTRVWHTPFHPELGNIILPLLISGYLSGQAQQDMSEDDFFALKSHVDKYKQFVKGIHWTFVGEYRSVPSLYTSEQLAFHTRTAERGEQSSQPSSHQSSQRAEHVSPRVGAIRPDFPRAWFDHKIFDKMTHEAAEAARACADQLPFTPSKEMPTSPLASTKAVLDWMRAEEEFSDSVVEQATARVLRHAPQLFGLDIFVTQGEQDIRGYVSIPCQITLPGRIKAYYRDLFLDSRIVEAGGDHWAINTTLDELLAAVARPSENTLALATVHLGAHTTESHIYTPYTRAIDQQLFTTWKEQIAQQPRHNQEIQGLAASIGNVSDSALARILQAQSETAADAEDVSYSRIHDAIVPVHVYVSRKWIAAMRQAGK